MLTITDHDRLYWRYEYDMTAQTIVPLLKKWGKVKTGGTLLDVGCGDGGGVCALADAGFRCKGFDLESRRIELAEAMKGDRHCEFLTGDLASERRPYREERFDVVFLHDVIEHLDRKEEMLRVLGDYLSPGGKVVVTFPPYYSAFGAHQQLLKSGYGRIPFIHLLPGFVGRIVPRLKGEPAVFVAEICKLARNRMGIASFEKFIRQAGLSVERSELYLLSPNYIRFGLRPVRAGILGKIPGLREIIASGAVYLLSK